MFKLQRLEITGFKSFADYTEIVFTGSGITAVVGPNGCGKSNVSDAISWVLGEQRARSLRGEEMKDVIFQGTKKRNPGGMAEVVLHMVRDEIDYLSDESDLEEIDEKLGVIDDRAVNVDLIEAATITENGDQPDPEANLDKDFVVAKTEEGVGVDLGGNDAGFEKAQAAQVGSIQVVEKKVKTKRRWQTRKFALDFAPGEAVSVTRRLYLSGESEYLLNDKNCRLRDIQDLFAGTGLSGAHYAIVEQGRIGQILSSKPSARRELIEEAAGVSKFRKRQRAAETRLESAKTNLGRISDIVLEIEKQVRSLQRQANKTKRYRILRDELRTLLKQIYAVEGLALKNSIDDLEQELGQAVSGEGKINEELNSKDAAFQKATADARQAEETLTNLRATHSENALKRDREERDVQYHKDQIRELSSRSDHLNAEMKVTEERIRLLKGELKRLEEAARKESVGAEVVQNALLEAEVKYRKKLDQMNAIEVELEDVRSSHLEHTAAVERLAEIDRQFESNLEKLRERIEGLRRENERADEVFQSRKDESTKLLSGIEKERKKLKSLENEKTALINLTNKIRKKLKKEIVSLNEHKEAFSRQKHRLETLNELEEKRAIYAPNVQKLFSEEKKVGVEFLGTLADRIKVDEKVEQAIENLFGNFLQTIIVRNEAAAKKVVKYLNKNNLGRVPVLVFDEEKDEKLKKNPKSEKIGDVMGLSKPLQAVLSEVFPREMKAILIDDIDNGANIDGLTLTVGGDLVIGGKLFIGGRSVDENKRNSSLLAFKREQRNLAKEFAKTKKRLEKSKKNFEKQEDLLTRKENDLVDLQAFFVKVERELLSQEVHSKSLSQEIERAERHQKVIADEQQQIKNEIKQIEKRRVESAQNGETAKKARALSKEKIERVNQELQKIRRIVESESAILGEKRTRAEVAAERERATKNSLNRAKTEVEEFESRLARQNTERESNKQRVKDLEEELVRLQSSIKASKEEINREEIELKKAIEHLKVSRESSDLLTKELGELNKLFASARDRRASIEINRTEAVTRIKSLEEKSQQDLNSSLASLIEEVTISTDFDLQDSLEEAESLRNRLENFGAINMLALEELADAEERLDFLTQQRGDIVASINATEEALCEIKNRSRQKFREAFEAVNANFKDFFAELFGGGTGAMTLLEAEDILESGVEISAQPPGKRLQNMLLLSGGEKAMTAIALVLAIFKYRPSPFCLLDEVDAPLDEANVGRFVARIDEMSENTQFIVITHNKRTMEAAKALYGVTMQEAGVSKVVSVRFE